MKYLIAAILLASSTSFASTHQCFSQDSSGNPGGFPIYDITVIDSNHLQYMTSYTRGNLTKVDENAAQVIFKGIVDVNSGGRPIPLSLTIDRGLFTGAKRSLVHSSDILPGYRSNICVRW